MSVRRIYYGRHNRGKGEQVCALAAFYRLSRKEDETGIGTGFTGKAHDGVPGSYIPEAIEDAKRSIFLSPNNDAGYVALGSIQTAFTWQWSEAEHNLVRGLEINSRNATGRVWYAVLLQNTGRSDQAMEQARQAAAAEPLSFFAVRMEGPILYYAATMMTRCTCWSAHVR